ncbi:MAG: epimerase [Roseomonas sp.]|nr:epimerase [Roseomonas sp.]
MTPVNRDRTPLVALTGGTGFIGRHVAAALARAGWQVRMLARRDAIHPLLATVPLELVLGDLGDEAALARLLRGADAIVHLAGLTKAPDLDAFLRVNRDGAGLLATVAAREAPGGRCILMSSLAAREPAISAYAASKRAGEDAVRAARGGAAWTILRPGVVYGPGDIEGMALRRLASSRLVPVPSPEPRIAMIHVADLAGAVAALCGAPAPGGNFELSDARNEGYGFGDVLGLTAELLGHPPPRRIPLPDPVFQAAGLAADLISGLTRRRGIFGRGKVRELLHRQWHTDPALSLPSALWAPGITLRDGMAETVRWWQTGAR